MKYIKCLLVVAACSAVNSFTIPEVKQSSSSAGHVTKFKSLDQLSNKHRMAPGAVVKRTHKESAKISSRSDIVKSYRAPGMFVC
jgi:hypothetical protein